MTKAKRLGWDEQNSGVTDNDILDPYDYDSDDLDGEVFVIQADGPYVKEHTQYLINGQLADPKSIDPDELLAALAVFKEGRDIEQTLYRVRQTELLQPATRKFPLTQVTRKVQLDPTPCKECQANSDPNNVPVHPGCKCSIITTNLERPNAQPSTEDMRLLAEVLSKVDSADPGLVRPDFVVEGQLVPQPDTIVAIDRFRFADLLAYVSENEDRLNQAGQLLGILFDNEDLSEDTESGTANLVFINDLLEAGTGESEGSFVPNITHALKPRSIILPPNASTSELATAYRLLREARKHAS